MCAPGSIIISESWTIYRVHEIGVNIGRHYDMNDRMVARSMSMTSGLKNICSVVERVWFLQSCWSYCMLIFSGEA